MKTLKHTVLIAALSLIGFSALAQTFEAPTSKFIRSGGVQNVAAATTNSYSAIYSTNQVDVRYQQTVPISVSFTGSGAGTDNITFVFSRTIGNPAYSTNWVTTGTHRVTFAQNAAVAVTGMTNITVAGEGYLALTAIENPSAARYMTNIVIRYADKHL